MPGFCDRHARGKNGTNLCGEPRARIAAILATMAAFSLAACERDRSEDTPHTARGATEVRYVICSAADKDCFVSARFAEFSSCETYKKFSEMGCDSLSNPSRMTCAVPSEPSLAHAFCTQ